MRQYRLIQPQVNALCEKYGIPYRQESVFRWFGGMLDMAVGRTSLREREAFPRGLTAGRERFPVPAHAAVATASDGAEAVLSTERPGRHRNSGSGCGLGLSGRSVF